MQPLALGIDGRRYSGHGPSAGGRLRVGL